MHQMPKQRERCGTAGAANIVRCHPQTIQKLKLDPEFPKSVGPLLRDEYYVDELEAFVQIRLKRKEEALAKRRASRLKQQERSHRQRQPRQRVAV